MSEPAANEKFSFIEMLGKHPGIAAAVGGIAVVSVWGIYLWQFRFGLSDSQETWGQFGDFVGGTLNSVFGFLGFLILLNSLRVQAKELEETRKELRASSVAQKMQAEHFEREAKKKDHIDAISYLVKQSIIDSLPTTIEMKRRASNRYQTYNITNESTPCSDEIKNNYDITDKSITKISELVNKLKFVDHHCYGLWSVSPLSPNLLDPINIYEEQILTLERKGWITDLKFFGKHDFPIR